MDMDKFVIAGVCVLVCGGGQWLEGGKDGDGKNQIK